MEWDLSFVTDEKGNKYVISQEIEDSGKRYYLTRSGVYEKTENGKIVLSAKEINDKYMPLLTETEKKEYIVEKKEIDL